MRLMTAALAATLSLASTTATASEALPGLVANISSWDNGWVLFNQMGSRNGPPPCQSPDSPKAWALSVTSVAGQAQYAMLLTAMAQGKLVRIMGQGGCSVNSSLETVQYVNID